MGILHMKAKGWTEAEDRRHSGSLVFPSSSQSRLSVRPQALYSPPTETAFLDQLVLSAPLGFSRLWPRQ